MEILLEKRPELIDLTDSGRQQHAALHGAQRRPARGHVAAALAMLYGSTGAIKALLRHCPDVAELVDRYGSNAFHVSADSGKAKALQCLLRHVRSVELLINRVNANGDTPLHIAANRSHGLRTAAAS
nr:unnamed protein product [Digitaria exilis]